MDTTTRTVTSGPMTERIDAARLTIEAMPHTKVDVDGPTLTVWSTRTTVYFKAFVLHFHPYGPEVRIATDPLRQSHGWGEPEAALAAVSQIFDERTGA